MKGDAKEVKMAHSSLFGSLSNHYFNDLTSAEKKIYKQIIDGLKIRKREIVLTQKPSTKVNNAIALENPQLFYVNLKVMEYSTDGLIYKYRPQYILDDLQTRQIEKTIRGMLSAFRAESEERTIRNVHNYFIKNIKYDYSDEVTMDYFNHNLVNIFTKQKGVCEGISLAFQYLLKLMDIECVSIDGVLDGGDHRWNIVLVDDYTYHVDVTSDIGCTQKGFNKPCYFYYLITDKEISSSHYYTEKFNCIQTKDNPFYSNHRVFYNRYELKQYLSSIPRSVRTFYFMYLGGDMTLSDMTNFVMNNTPRSLFSMAYSFLNNPTNTMFYYNR